MSALFFAVFGVGNWRIMAVIWASVPFLNAFFFLRVPIYKLTEQGGSIPVKKLLSMKPFWIFVFIMVCAGASELSMSQWASAFTESALGVTKIAGDMLGPCLFAVMMGISRVVYSKFSEKINLNNFMLYSGCLGAVSYLMAALIPFPSLALAGCALCGFSSGILWPGTFSLASAKFPLGGTAMFAYLALAGDLGAAAGPMTVGFVAGAAGDDIKAGLLVSATFPVLLVIGLLLYSKSSKKML